MQCQEIEISPAVEDIVILRRQLSGKLGGDIELNTGPDVSANIRRPRTNIVGADTDSRERPGRARAEIGLRANGQMGDICIGIPAFTLELVTPQEQLRGICIVELILEVDGAADVAIQATGCW